MVKDKEDNEVSNKEKFLKRPFEYYKKHFELLDGTDKDRGQRTMCKQTAEPYAEWQNDVDVVMTIRKLENRKATGHDQFPAELIKKGGTELKKVIYELSHKIVEEEIISHGRKYGMCPT
jgi:hypothetical protein